MNNQIVDKIENYYFNLDDEQREVAFVQMALALFENEEILFDDEENLYWNADGESVGNV